MFVMFELRRTCRLLACHQNTYGRVAINFRVNIFCLFRKLNLISACNKNHFEHFELQKKTKVAFKQNTQIYLGPRIYEIKR